MNNTVTPGRPVLARPALPSTLLIVAGLVLFCALFVVADNAFIAFADARFPHVGASTGLANLWGVGSRSHLILLLLPFVIWRSRWLGFRMGEIRSHWRMLLVMLLANCGVIAVYLWLTGSGTPFSGNQWLLTEIVTVPLVEETLWRGLVLTALLSAFRALYPDRTSEHLAVWLSGLAFGLMHAKNMVTGTPLPFAALQALNAMVWGVVYGYARTRTRSIYPAIVLHAAMNLVVVLF